jgi:uncharacterized protein (DUF952 family)
MRGAFLLSIFTLTEILKMDKIILHITTRHEWEAALKQGFYKPEMFDVEDFIHCSTTEQVVDTANKFFKDEADLVLLCIIAKKVKGVIVYENLVGGEKMYPHIYAPLNTDAVERVIDFHPAADGHFQYPEALNLLFS